MTRISPMVLAVVAWSAFSGAAFAQQSIGIAACDEYITGYTRCIRSHVPEDQREGLLTLLEQTAKVWIETIKNSDFRPMIEKTCEANLKQMRRAMKRIGCDM